ncbi:hypothetical protein Tco_1151390, partial [Tanacetum coccineum]
FIMAQQPQQQVIHVDQLVTKYQRIGRCNNFAMLQNIPCLEECKIVGILLVDHALSHALTTTTDVPFDTLKLLVETSENPFIVPADLKYILRFLRIVGYEGIVDKIFHDVVNRVHVDYAGLLWWDFLHCVHQKKDSIQYSLFTKLIITDLMKKFPSIAPRLKEDNHSIKDDVPLGGQKAEKRTK